jgi:nicotinate phosphoribosyltransferase
MSDSALIVDLYELTMAAGYFQQNYNPIVTFELFIRELPPERNFLISAGQEQAVDYLTNLYFSKEQAAYLRGLPNFKYISQDFFEYLETFKFSGNLYGLPEGTVVFANEPILQVEAPLIEAQIVETFLLSSINFQTMVASKAARVILASRIDGRQRGVMEFGSRRAHGPTASELAARSAYLAGFMGTSNVLAGQKYNIPVYGTTAHSWTMAFDNELEAFQKYYEIFKEDSVFLIDTYDMMQGLEHAMQTADKFAAVRIDSGDLGKEAKKVRKLLDQSGRPDVKIILSSELNETKIAELIQQGTPVDFFGVGTQVVTSADAPTLQGVYKMVALEKNGKTSYRAKFSHNKITLPGKKQIRRYSDIDGKMRRDVLSLHNEPFSDEAESLIIPLIVKGERVLQPESAEAICSRVKQNIGSLPGVLLDLKQKTEYKIELSEKLNTLLNTLKQKIK